MIGINFSFIVVALTGLVIAPHGIQARSMLDIREDQIKDASNLQGIRMVDRLYVPYGPDLNDPDYKAKVDNANVNGRGFTATGYGYGMEAVDRTVFDKFNHYMYTTSRQGYLIVSDFGFETTSSGQQGLATTPYNIFLWEASGRRVPSMEVCGKGARLYVIHWKPDDDLQDEILVYQAVQRSNPSAPKLLRKIPVRKRPANVLLSTDCSTLIVAHTSSQGGADGSVVEGASVTIIRNLDSINAEGESDNTGNNKKVTVSNIRLDERTGWDDYYLLNRGLNMPVTRNALTYWDQYSGAATANSVDFADVIQPENYRPSIFLGPEILAWTNPQETEFAINMQINNGLIRIRVNNDHDSGSGDNNQDNDVTILDVAGYGLKDHSQIPLDLNPNDKACNLKTYENLFAMRNPDGFVTFRYNGQTYVLTGNEGDDFEYRGFEFVRSAKDVFKGSEFGFENMLISDRFFDPADPLNSPTAPFNSECTGPFCVPRTNFDLGSNAIDYESDPTNPIFHRMVLGGGRGWSLFELPQRPSQLLRLVYDSADTVEKLGCERYPWAHNTVMDEESAPGANYANNTYYTYVASERKRQAIDAMNDPLQDGCADVGDGTPGACPLSEFRDSQSRKRGVEIGTAVIGYACGRLISVVVGEGNSVSVLYDITELNNPTVVDVIHLNPSGESTGPGLAYNRGELGEVDIVKMEFLVAHDSPTGKAGLIYIGKSSNTMSFWEFECQEPDDPTVDLYTSNSDNDNTKKDAASSSSSLSSKSAQLLLVITLSMFALAF